MITKKSISSISWHRITCQREIILDYLRGVTTHPTAEDVYFQTKKKLPRISRGTVYRVLKSLKEEEKAQEIPVKGVTHFDANMSPHGHFICQKCEKIFDIFGDLCGDCKIIKNKRTKVGKIENYKINFYGYCKNCSKK